MMDDGLALLAKAIEAEFGLDPDGAAEKAMAVAGYLNRRHFYVQESEIYRERRAREEYAAKVAAEKAAALAAAIPYSGAIQRCQASVWEGRGGSHRCLMRPKFVVRLRASNPDSYGDHRLAVCMTHAKDPTRYLDPIWRTGATEVVEPEYQP